MKGFIDTVVLVQFEIGLEFSPGVTLMEATLNSFAAKIKH